MHFSAVSCIGNKLFTVKTIFSERYATRKNCRKLHLIVGAMYTPLPKRSYNSLLVPVFSVSGVGNRRGSLQIFLSLTIILSGHEAIFLRFKVKYSGCFKRIHVFLVCCRDTDTAFSSDFLRVAIFPDVIFSLSIPEKNLIFKMFE